jgi:hypothetical protein
MKSKNLSRCLFTGLAVAFSLAPRVAQADEVANGALKSADPSAGLFQPPLPGDVATLPESEIIGASWKTDPDPDVRAFAKWVAKFLAATTEDQWALEEEGIELAKARQKVIKAQILTDPRRALANAVPLAVRAQLPIDVQKYLEKRVDAFGDWGTKCTLPPPGSKTQEPKEEEVAQAGNQSFRAHHYGDRNARHIEGGSLHGIAIDGELAVLDSPLRALEPGEMPGRRTVDFTQVDDMHGSKTERSAGRRTGGGVGRIATGATSGAKGARFYQIGSGVYGKGASAAQVDKVESVLKLRQNNYENVREAVSSSDDWIVPDDKNYLADSGAPGSTGMPWRPPASHTNGNKTVLIMRVQSPAHPLDPWLQNNTNLTNQSADINARYSYISNNRVSITFAYTPVYTLPASFDNFNADAWRDEARARAQSSGFNLNNYQVHVTMHGGADTGYGGLQSGNHLWLNNTYGQFVFIHEFGHWLSLPHSGLFQVTDGNPMSPNRTIVPYGDGTCYMGASYNNYNLSLYNPAYQNKLRWMNDNDVQTVTRSGTYTIYQYDGPTENRVRALKLPRDDNFNFWLSIRGNVDGAYPAHTNGVAIRAQNGWNPNDAWVVDMHPNDGGSENAPLLLNEEWYDSAADVRIKTVAVGGSSPNRSVTVQITLGASHNAGYRPLVNGGIYRFAHRANLNQSLTGVAGSANSAPIVMAASSDTNALQQWLVQRNSNGSYSFNLLGTDKWIDISNNDFGNNVDILQYTGNGSDAQKFYVNQNQDGYITMGHRNGEGHSGYIIDVDLANQNVRQWSMDNNIGSNAQQWKPELIGLSSNRKYRLFPANGPGQALDVSGDPNLNGNKVQLWNWSGQVYQQWTAIAENGGFRFKSEFAPTKYLDIDQPTGRAQLWESLNVNNQRYNLSRLGGHYVRLIPQYNTALSLDASGTGGNGTPIYVTSNNGGNNQRWRFGDWDG